MNTSMKLIAATALIAALSTTTAMAQGAGKGMVASNCKAEIAKYCANVPHTPGNVPACLAKQKDKLSATCKQALDNRGPGGGMGQGNGPKYKNR